MIPKSGNRFSEKITRKQNVRDGTVAASMNQALATAPRTSYLMSMASRYPLLALLVLVLVLALGLPAMPAYALSLIHI